MLHHHVVHGRHELMKSMNPPLAELKKNPKYNRKLRIVLCGARGVPHSYGGAETFYREMAPRLVARGHEVIVYNRRSLFKERPSHYQGVRLVYVPSIETKNFGTITAMLYCVFDVLFRKADILMCTNVGSAAHLAVPGLFGINVVCNVDGMEWKRGKWGSLARNYIHLMAKTVGKICPRGIITDAYEMHRIYLEDFHTPSACIAYGAPIETSNNPDVVRQFGLVPGEYYLIASRMIPENNADLIIEGFNRVKTNKVLAIAGGDNHESDFIRKVKSMAGPEVRFLGHIENPDYVKELHCNCYAYVHGHTMGGTNPALVKSLAYGNMVVVLNTPFNSEVVEDYGVLFEKSAEDLAAKLQYVEDHPGVAAEYRRRAPDRIREAYTWDHITDQYEEFYLLMAAGDDPTRTHSTVVNHLEAQARTLAMTR
jgi:glycosyltransferase involved in cell wall biosynthesis